MLKPHDDDIELLRRVAVPVFVYDRSRVTTLTACLVARDAALTAGPVAESSADRIQLEAGGTRREARIEVVDEAGLALLRFSPPITGELPSVLSTVEQAVARHAPFTALAYEPGVSTPIEISGVVTDPVTAHGHTHWQLELPGVPLDPAQLSGAPVAVAGQVLGLLVTRLAPGLDYYLPLVIVPFSALRGGLLASRLASEATAPDDPLFAMLSKSSRAVFARADAMRRAMQFESVHLRQLVAALQQQPGSLAAAALGAAGVDERGLRELIARTTGDMLPETVQPDALSTLPPLSLRAREAVVAASRLSSDGIIHMRDLFAGAMSITGSSFIHALIERGVQVPPTQKPATADAGAAPRSAPDATGTAPPAPAAGISALAGFRSDTVSDQNDLLDIERDVAALCSVIAARDVEPPLSIGLFGDWGSGKSFFLASMRKRLERLEEAADLAEQEAIACGRPPGEATRYCARITQLEFNAWRYIDTDLWASLADGIIDGLSRALERSRLGKVSATERARLLTAAAHSRDVIAQAEADKRIAESNLRDQEHVLAQARARAETPPRGATAIRKEARVLAIAASADLRDELTEVTTQLGVRAAGAEAKAALLDLRGLWGTTRAVWRAIRANSGAAVAGMIGLGALGLTAVVFHDRIDSAVHYLVGAAIAVMTAVASLRPYVQRAQRAVASIKQIVDKHDKALKTAQEEATRQERAKREQLAAAVEAAEHRLTEARRDLEQLETQLIALRADQQMVAFLKERQASDDYRKHLGVIARARSDFERMSDLLFRTRDDAPKPGLPRIDRIVLYIDDLDRCNEEQVVKVLQAVHLLLAFKLFVVVVAVDSRWLLRSLQQHARAFHTDAGADEGLSEEERLHWQSTPLNYLEKIFQIPFTLRPMAAAGFANVIDHLIGERANVAAGDATGDPVTSSAGTATAGAGPAPITAATAAPSDGIATESARTAETAAAPVAPANPGEPAAPRAAKTARTGSAADAMPPPGGGVYMPSAPSSPTEPPAPGLPPARPRPDDAPVNVLPPHLVIEPWEQSFMKQFHELIATPRAAKRFVNVYRLLKARVPEDRVAAFIGNARGGEHRAALFLLSLLIGFPSEATDLMRELTEKPAQGEWAPWLTTFLAGEKQAAAVKSAQQERLLDLTNKLAVILHRLTEQGLGLPSTEVFRFWTPYVARFSFQAGRLSAAVIPPSPVGAQADDPAPRKPRTAAGSSPPRDHSEAS